MTQENASLKPADMSPEVGEETGKPQTKAKVKGSKPKAKGRVKDARQTPAYKAVMVDVRPHLDVLCDALRKHRTTDNRTFSKVKRTIMDAMSTVSKERKDGLARQREAGKKTLEKARAGKVQERIAKAQERLDVLKRQEPKTKARK